MLFFKTRTAARAFAAKKVKFKFVDNGKEAPVNRRWGVQVL